MFNSSIEGRTAPKGREPNLPGDRYGRLTLVEEVAGCFTTARKWLCRCECGSERQVKLNNLRTGNTLSCGCYKRETTVKANRNTKTTHGLRRHPLYDTFGQMLKRCYNPKNKQFSHYGARGILVCERWHSLENFIADMAPSHQPGLSLERVDNNLGYSPDNCVWASDVQQARNKRSNRLVAYQGKNICLAEACEIACLPYGRVNLRLNRRGWSLSRALESEDFSDPLPN